eukprot:jgi/Bigna1/66556/fgenesh1_pg.1_\
MREGWRRRWTGGAGSLGITSFLFALGLVICCKPLRPLLKEHQIDPEIGRIKARSLQRARIKRLAKENMELRTISDVATYVLDGMTEGCLATLFEKIDQRQRHSKGKEIIDDHCSKQEAKARQHHLLGPQHLKHCLQSLPAMERILGKIVQDAPPIDMKLTPRSSKKKEQKRATAEKSSKDTGKEDSGMDFSDDCASDVSSI